MESISSQRFYSGQRCTQSGRYCFDGYVDGSRSPAPDVHEAAIEVRDGGRFPVIESVRKPCWWLLVDEQDETDRAVRRMLDEGAGLTQGLD